MSRARSVVLASRPSHASRAFHGSRTRIALVAALPVLPGARAFAQAPAEWPEQSVRGMAAVGLAASASRQAGAPAEWSGGALYAPFVTEHWQIGTSVGAGGATALDGFRGYSAGSVGLLADYWIGSNRRSRPHVGAYATAVDGRNFIRDFSWGGRVGWSYFVTPFTALDASFNATRFGYTRVTYTALHAGLQPYTFNRAAGAGAARRRAQAPGALDLAVDATAALSPTRDYALRLGVAPFLLRALQVGGTVDAEYWGGRRGTPGAEAFTRRAFEGFAPVYYPTRGTLQPFAGAFLSTASGTPDAWRNVSRGASAGVRAYPNPGMALDVSLELRHFTEPDPIDGVSRRPDRLAVRLGLTPHFSRPGR
jgi:hypothetical protein